MNTNHKKNQLRRNPDNSVEASSFESIIPDADTLERLEAIAPGVTAKWVDAALNEINHRQQIEHTFANGYVLTGYLQIICSLVSSLAIVFAGCYAIYLGHYQAGASIIIATTASVITAFLLKGSKTKNQENKK